MFRIARPRPLLAGLLCLTLPGLMLTPTSAQAWGRIGHRVSARLAEQRLTPQALAAVRALLEPGESLADASLWADEVRRQRPESGPWHYINVPITAETVDRARCSDEGCVLSAIDDMRKTLANPQAPLEKRREALRFLVHFVQDLHQPVHVGDRSDRGGNDLQVQFFRKGSNLHRVWDSGLIERHSTDEARWIQEVGELLASPEATVWTGGTPQNWADESLAAARAAYRMPGSDTPLKAGARLEEAYLDAHLPVVRERLARSSVRLAEILNATLR